MSAASAFFNSSASSRSEDDLQNNQPSIFHLLAADNLQNTIRPAIKHALRMVATRYPATLGFLQRFADEIYLAFDLFLQKHYLSVHGALFAEHFYGLERRKLVEKWSNVALNSILFGVLLPYAKQKLDDLFERLREEEAEGVSKKHELLNLSRRYLLLIYPYLHALYEGSVFCFSLGYALGKSKTHSPWARLAGVQLTYQRPNAEKMAARGTASRRGIWPKVGRGLAAGLTVGLEAGAFFLQFLDWWYSRESTPQDLTSLPIPPPPSLRESPHGSLPTQTCPLCRNPFRNATVLPVSGLVFCYSCIVRHLREEGAKCPVTKCPAKEEDLIRIYSQQG